VSGGTAQPEATRQTAQVSISHASSRIPPSVSHISAITSVLVIPYYFVGNQPNTAWAMSALAALNFASGWWRL